MSAPSKDTLTPSELVLIHGQRFARHKRPITLTLALLGASVMCAYMAFLAVDAIRDDWAARSWPRVQGIIVSSQVLSKEDTYRADVQFTYEVDRHAYNGDTVAFGTRGVWTGSEYDARGIVNRYPAGAPVKVAYDPSNPATGVLEAGIHGVSVVIVVMTLVATIAFVALVIAQLPALLRR
jgi:Protein of unknown function (DUF3592)